MVESRKGSSRAESGDRRRSTPLAIAGSLAGIILTVAAVEEIATPDKEGVVAEYYGYPAPKNIGDAVGALTDRGKFRITVYDDDRTEFGLFGRKYNEVLQGEAACVSPTQLVFSGFNTVEVAFAGRFIDNDATLEEGFISDQSIVAQTLCQSGEITADSIAQLQQLSPQP